MTFSLPLIGESQVPLPQQPIKHSAKAVYCVEVSGVCQYENFCSWCSMFSRPRARKRGLMSDEIVKRSIYWVDKLEKVDAVALHLFGEPAVHPKFVEIAREFSKVSPITVSTNGQRLDDKMADEWATIPWQWVTVSVWKDEDAIAAKRLTDRGVKVVIQQSKSHNWAGQAENESSHQGKSTCQFSRYNRVVIRWNGDCSVCCISDRAEDVIGHVDMEPSQVFPKWISLCPSCHMAWSPYRT